MSDPGRTATVETAPDQTDQRLRGRTYAIPFHEVWQTAHALAAGQLRGWKLIEDDDYEGIIRAESHALMMRSISDVEIRIFLDENAQTRVDLKSASRKGKLDFGGNARRIAKFCRSLDERLKQRKPPT